jgi:hypothetical protein
LRVEGSTLPVKYTRRATELAVHRLVFLSTLIIQLSTA